MDTNILLSLKQLFQKALQEAFPDLSPLDLMAALEVTQSNQPQHGDYQCNSAMKLARPLKQSPRDIAQKLCQQLPLQPLYDGLIASTNIAGPGFINITISDEHLCRDALHRLRDLRLGIYGAHPQRIIIDFSSPNTAKEMHVGHLRSTIIGDSLARLFEFLGNDVLRLNHIGDWGTSFGMLIAYMKRFCPEVLTGKEQTDLTHLVQWYKSSKELFDNDPAFKKLSQSEVVALQSGDADARAAWHIICEISRRAYQEIYDLLGVQLQERGESYYNEMLPWVVDDLQKKGLITLSDGAKCMYLEGFQNREGEPLPLMLQKSDGGYNYDTTDMAAIYHRIHEEKGQRLIYVTDAGQANHFKMIFQAAEKAGYLDPSAVRTEHVPFGLVLGEDGKKFRTRSGATEKLLDLLMTAVESADAILAQREDPLPPEERQKTARALGLGAVKYADLSCNRTSDYTFSYERMLRFDGNTAAFLMYSYVRANSIKRRINVDINAIIAKDTIVLSHPSERTLLLALLQLPETLSSVAEDLMPHRLCDYLYSIAEKFNAFFRDCRVEGTPQQNSRLLLCELFARTMKLGLHILGVETVAKM